MARDSNKDTDLEATQALESTFFLSNKNLDLDYRAGFLVCYNENTYMITSKDLILNSTDVSNLVVAHKNLSSASDTSNCNFKFKWVGSGNKLHSFAVMEVLSPDGKNTLEVSSAGKARLTDEVIYMGFPRGRKDILSKEGFPIPFVYQGSLSSGNSVNGFWDPSLNGSPVVIRTGHGNKGSRIWGVVCGQGYKGNEPLDPYGHFSVEKFSDVLEVIDIYQGKNSD